MPLIYTLGIPAVLVFGYLRGMRWRYVARERRNTSDGFRATVVANALALSASAALTWWALSCDDAPEAAVARAIDLILPALT